MTSVSTNEPFYTVENQREVVITRSVITYSSVPLPVSYEAWRRKVLSVFFGVQEALTAPNV